MGFFVLFFYGDWITLFSLLTYLLTYYSSRVPATPSIFFYMQEWTELMPVYLGWGEKINNTHKDINI